VLELGDGCGGLGECRVEHTLSLAVEPHKSLIHNLQAGAEGRNDTGETGDVGVVNGDGRP
jgi:hypothetical protein